MLEADLFDGEITLYGGKVALTSYKESGLQTIVINDKALTQTFQAIFEACWAVAALSV